jgi:hypothetical protein
MIKQAIEDGTLAIGMTLAEANAAMKVKGFRSSRDAEGEVYQWEFYDISSARPSGIELGGPQTPGVPPRVVRLVSARFVNGKIVSFRDGVP